MSNPSDQATQMRHIVDVALKTKKKIQESKPNNIAQQFLTLSG